MKSWLKSSAVAACVLVLAASGCGRKPDAEQRTITFAREGSITTLVLKPSPGQPALAPLLTKEYGQRQVTSAVVEAADAADLSTKLSTAIGTKPATVVVELPASNQPVAQLKNLVSSGTSVLCLGSRPVEKAGQCTVFVGWDDWAAGFEQGVALAQALGPIRDGRRWNVELFGLDPKDASGKNRFEGTVFQQLPHKQDSPTITKTGQLSYSQTSVPNADPVLFQKHLATTIEATYLSQPLDGLVIATDAYIDSAVLAAKRWNKPLPTIVSADASTRGVRALMEGTIAATQYRDPTLMAHEAALTLSTVRNGAPLIISPRRSSENGLSLKTPAVFITPRTVTKNNARNVFVDAPELLKLVNQ